MSDFETIVRHTKDFGNRLLHLKNTNKLFDAEIIVSTKRFAVHSIILASTCEYFENEFVQMESTDKKLFLNDANPDIVQLLIDYCYTGKIIVSNENVMEILKMANMFIMTPVVEGCVRICEKILNPSNCISIWKLARTEYLDNLNNIAFECIKKNFEQVSQLTEVLDLNYSEMVEILNSDIVVISETPVFNIVMKWISHDSASRKQHLDQLSSVIKFENLPKNILLSESRTLCSYNSSNACYAKILNALQQKEQKNVYVNSENLRDSYSTLIAVGCNNSAIPKTMEIFDLRKHKWTKIEKFECDRILFSAVLLEDKLILIGGSKDSIVLNTVQSYNLKTDTMENLPPMKYTRQRLSAVQFQGGIYAIGGTTNFCISHTEMWNPALKEWKELAPMPTSRCGCEAKVLGEEIFVLGGSSKGTSSLSDTESYNPLTDKWTRRSPMNEKRYALGAATVGGYLYALGGFGINNTVLMTAERYDPKIDKWTMIHSIGIGRYWLGAGNIIGKLVVVGGTTPENQKLSTMEMYNEENDNWTAVPSMSEGRSTLRTVQIPWGLAKITLSNNIPK